MSSYKIYRSDDNDQNNMIDISGDIEANNLPQTTHYTFSDETVELNNTYYYWLQAVSIDGTTKLLDPLIITIEDPILPCCFEITQLNSNYPNPFNPVTTFEFTIKNGDTGKFSIYNAKGQVIESKTYDSGLHSIVWDGTNYGSGIYFYKLETDSFSQIKKMMMLK